MYNKVEKKTPKWVEQAPNLLLGFRQIQCLFVQYELFYLSCDYCIWNRLEALKKRLLSLGKDGLNTNWFKLFDFNNYLNGTIFVSMNGN